MHNGRPDMKTTDQPKAPAKNQPLQKPTPEQLAGEALAPSGALAYVMSCTVPHIHNLVNAGIIPVAHRTGPGCRYVRFHIPSVLVALEKHATKTGKELGA